VTRQSSFEEVSKRMGYTDGGLAVLFWLAVNGHEKALLVAVHDGAGPDGVRAVSSARLLGGVTAALDVLRAMALPRVVVSADGVRVR
jgi:hypothetical protein